MRRGVARFIQVDEAMADIVLDISLQWGAACFQRSVVASPHYHAMIVLQYKRRIHNKPQVKGIHVFQALLQKIQALLAVQTMKLRTLKAVYSVFKRLM